VEALTSLVGDFPADLPAVIGVVLHFPPNAASVLPNILHRAGSLPAAHAVSGMALEPGHIFVAPPDQHLLVDDGRWVLTRGPRENGHRPAIDPLFRTAAQAYGPRVIGVIVSGTLDDGVAGLRSVKRHGGLAVVQDPADARFGAMPRNAIENVQVDYVLPLAQLGERLTDLIRLLAQTPDAGAPSMTADSSEYEAAAVTCDKGALEHGDRPGQPTLFTCPDCGGVIWELDEGETLRFRCHVGHAYSIESFQAAQGDVLEAALWTAYRTLQEKASFSRRLAEWARRAGNANMAARYAEQARAVAAKAALVQQALLHSDVSDARPPEPDPASTRSAPSARA
jgi:two-component system chemotaxis response regulator CheB